jgi:hypothetical protein
MAYVLGGADGENYGFTFAIANFALRAMHESLGLVNMTNVVTPTQGNQFLVPNFAPITYQDFNPAADPATAPWNTGNAAVQNPSLSQTSILASPAVATTAFDIFYGWTTSYQLAATLGAELGDSFAEKVDQRVTQAFAVVTPSETDGTPTPVDQVTGFKPTPTNTYYPQSADGYYRVLRLGALELLPAGMTANVTPTAGFTSNSVLEIIRFAKQQFKVARMSGNPVVVLDSNGYVTAASDSAPGGSGSSLTRLLAELTGGSVSGPSSGGSNLSALGNELLSTGKIENVYGCMVMFTTFLVHKSRTIAGNASTPCLVGAYFGDSALFTVMKEGLQIKIGEVPGGLQNWLTGIGYFGSGVGDQRRGGCINIVQDA